MSARASTVDVAARVVAGGVAAFALATCALSMGCARSPSPLAPTLDGSVGMPHRGVLTQSAELPREGEGWKWLRRDGRHFATPRFAEAIERASAKVLRARPGPKLMVGDLSVKGGGQLLPHLSHRTGRDADLLLFATTLEGAPIESPGFVHYGPDGIAWDEAGARFLRLDVEREWLLVKALVEDDAARVQWIFVSHEVEALLIEWAFARGEPVETIYRAEDVMAQPGAPAAPHDDHVHVRTACTDQEVAHGCEPTGPARSWMATAARATPADDDADLVAELLRPLDAPPTTSTSPREGP